MIGIEGVAQAEGVGQHAGAEAEGPCPHVVVARHHEEAEDAEADDVKEEDERCHPPNPTPLARGQTVADGHRRVA